MTNLGADNNISVVPVRIENAAVLPKMVKMRPLPAKPPFAQLRNQPRHLAPGFAARLPIRFCGVAEAVVADPCSGIAEKLFLYHDVNGLPRCFNSAGHDRDGIASLFAGDEWRLARLWPHARCRWDHNAASETLYCQQSRIGIACDRDRVIGIAGFLRFVPGRNGLPLIAERSEAQRAHLAIGRLARRLLWREVDPYRVLELARDWNARHGPSVLGDDIVIAIVDATCARELRGAEDRRDAG